MASLPNKDDPMQAFNIPTPTLPSIDQIIKKILGQVVPGAFPGQESNKINSFLKIDGIKGESKDDDHKDEIEVLDFHWSVSQPRSATASSSATQSTERAHFGDLTIYKAIDRSTPELAHSCASGRHISNARLQLCRSGGDEEPYMEYRMSDVIITSVRTGGHGYGEKIPLEEISLSYGAIEWKYIETEVESGIASGSLVKNWNLKTNKG